MKSVKEIKDEKFEKPFIFDCFYATMLLLLTMVVSLITWSLIKLINNRDQRNIDRIIKWQTYILYFSGVYMTGYFFSGTVLPLPLKEYIGLVGCDITDLNLVYDRIPNIRPNIRPKPAEYSVPNIRSFLPIRR